MLAALEAWLREQRSRSSRAASVAQPIDYVPLGRLCALPWQWTNLSDEHSAEALLGFVTWAQMLAVRRLRTRRRPRRSHR
jgi:hypothetical protein